MPLAVINIFIPMVLFVVCYFMRKSKRFQVLPLFYFAIMSMIGYDTVYDYAQYVTYFADVRHGYYLKQEDVNIGCWLINRLFTFSEYGYTLVMGLSYSIYYYSCYKVFKKFDCLLLGTFLFFLDNGFIQYENIIRQNFAIAIGNFIFLYLYGKKLSPKRIVVALLGVALAYSFHYSAILGVLLFVAIHFATRLRIRINVWSILIFLGLWVAIYFFGIFDQLADMLDMLGYYGDKTMSILENRDQIRGEHNIGLSVSLSTFILLFMFYFYNSKEHIYIVKFATIVILLSFLTIQIRLIHRVYLYFEIIEIVGICLVIKYLRMRRQLRIQALSIVMYFALMLYIEIKYLRNYCSDYPYKTIFSEDCRNGLVYIRDGTNDRRILYKAY